MSSLLPVLQILEHMQGGRRVNRRYARRSEDTEQIQARKALKNCELAQRQKKFGFKEAVISSRGECTGCRNPDDGTLDRKCKRCQYNEYYEAK